MDNKDLYEMTREELVEELGIVTAEIAVLDEEIEEGRDTEADNEKYTEWLEREDAIISRLDEIDRGGKK